jgi:hemin uptake protein HemP
MRDQLDRHRHRHDVDHLFPPGLARVAPDRLRLPPGRPAMIGAPQTAPEQAREPVVLHSTALLGDSREVEIRHGAETYRLKLTRHGKLILTK